MAAGRSQLYEYKGNRCAKCGMSVPDMVARYGTFERMFELHHINPATKAADYDNLIRRSLSTEQIDELDKCVLLCRQCHGIIHAQNRSATALLTMTYQQKTAQQQFTGQMIFDLVERTGTFITNEPVLLTPYLVQVGSRKPKIEFGTTLREERIKSFIDNLAKFKSVTIRNIYDDVMLQLSVVGRDAFRMTHDVRFPAAAFALTFNGAPSPYIWFRNGFALSQTGEILDRGTITLSARMLNP